MRIILRLNLIQHRLALLKQYQGLFEGFLGNKVNSAFIKLINHNWYLI